MTIEDGGHFVWPFRCGRLPNSRIHSVAACLPVFIVPALVPISLASRIQPSEDAIATARYPKWSVGRSEFRRFHYQRLCTKFKFALIGSIEALRKIKE
jgi:hypothetical protein